jgi:hypothetical protein
MKISFADIGEAMDVKPKHRRRYFRYSKLLRVKAQASLRELIGQVK